MGKIKSVCWDITSKCNDKCKFCFRDANSTDLSLDDNFLLLNKFIDYGIEKITFTGGEACLYDGLWELIQYAKSRNVYTNLVTNALNINDDFYYNIERYLDCITFSLDGADPKIQQKMTRNINHFDNVLNILKKLDKKNITINKKINTLVTRVNIKNVIDILPIIYEHKISMWKLFQFISPRYNSAVNDKYFSILNSDFNELKQKIISSNEKNAIILFQSEYDLRASYFVVSSNGNVRYDRYKESSFIGNLLLDSIDNIFRKIEFDYSCYIERKSLGETNVA